MENSKTKKPGTALIGANSKAQNCKRGRFGTQFFPKYGNKLEGTFGDIKSFREKLIGFLNSAEKCKRGPFGIFTITCKISKTNEGGPFVAIKKFHKKSQWRLQIAARRKDLRARQVSTRSSTSSEA